MSLQTLRNAIFDDDVDSMRAALNQDQRLLYTEIDWGNGRSGFALNYAAALNRTGLIQTLVEEYGADVNRQKGVGNNWSPLHHACDAGSLRAVQKLLELGADPLLRSGAGQVPSQEAKQSNIRELISAFLENPAALRTEEPVDKYAVKWKLGAPDEVSSVRLSPDGAFRLTEIFNFSLRRVTALAQEVSTKSLAQTVTYFDDIPDKRVLHEAFNQLSQLGGKADAATIDRAPLSGKKLQGGGKP